MPLPTPLLLAYRRATLAPVPGAGESWAIAAVEPPGAPPLAKSGPSSQDELEDRVGQTGLAWTRITLSSGAWSSPGVLLPGLTRARAVRLAQKLRRWAVLRVIPDRIEVLYTGINDRAL